MKIVEVAVDVPIRKNFFYALPQQFFERVYPGSRVIVPFGKKNLLRTGIVIDIKDVSIGEDEVKSVFDVPDTFPVFSPQNLELSKIIAERYGSSLGEVLFTFLPKGLVFSESVCVKLVGDKNLKLTSLERSIVEFLRERKREIKLSTLSKRFGSAVYHAVNSLALKGVVSKYERLKEEKLPKKKFVKLVNSSLPRGRKARELISLLKQRDFELSELLKRFSRSTINRLVNQGIIVIYEKVEPSALKEQSLKDKRDVELSPSQKSVLKEIVKPEPRTFLLYGVTGSGKMEVYLNAAKHFVNCGKSVLILVPELLLTPELRARVESYFGEGIGVYHSKLSEKERVSLWLKALKGDLKVVLGTRVSLMLPVKNLGLIVVDEEQDSSYKEQQRPYYNARDMAVKRGEVEKCSVVLVSAAPSVESYYKAKVGDFVPLMLKERVTSYPLPYIKLLDLKKEEKVSIFSKKLLTSIENTVKKGEQVLLFINRRGFYSSAFCPKCGFTPECKDCAVTLTYHKSQKKMICHICGKRYKPIYRCPKCKVRLEFKGYGTERVEEEIKTLYPEFKVIRLDQDTVGNQNKAADFIKRIKEGEFDVIVGTQLVSKGHNFPNLTLVAVLMADVSPDADFRKSERIFQTLINVTGRSGRFRYGAAIVQAYNPDLPSVKYAVNYEFDKFYEEEIRTRQIFNYPPFSYPVLVEFLLRDMDSFSKLEDKFLSLKEKLKGVMKVSSLSPAPIPKLYGKYRFQSFMRAFSEEDLLRGVKILSEELFVKFRRFEYKVNVEPTRIL